VVQYVILDDMKNCENVLLLQGPRGDFFRKFGAYLRKRGMCVHKINFNGGDQLFYPDDAVPFAGKLEDFEDFIEEFLREHDIGCLFLFGDCRPHHQIAKKVAHKKRLDVFVFEEGYIRPDYITLEKSGVNGFSDIPFSPYFYKALDALAEKAPIPAHASFGKMAFSAALYHLAEVAMRWRYPHYRYHKKYSLLTEPCYWVRSAYRKALYKHREKNTAKELSGDLKKKYFLVPLQVHDDSQVLFHSRYHTVEEFIEEVIASFAQSASKEHFLVFKHHPMDRGHKDYASLINRAAGRLAVLERIRYIHDLHLPILLKNAVGVVVINSTVGLSSLYHNSPVKVMGNAIYCIPGLTYQECLDSFWNNPGHVNKKLYNRFRRFIIDKTQLNGSYYGLFPFDETIQSENTEADLPLAPADLAFIELKNLDSGMKV